MKITTSIILAAGVILSISGCSSKQFYSKPSVFIYADNPSIVDNKSKPTKTQVYCLDNRGVLQDTNPSCDDNSTSLLDKYGNCRGYLSMYVEGNHFENSKDLDAKDKDAKDKDAKEVARKLLFLSDKNCAVFSNDFYFKEVLVQGGSELLSLNIFGIGGINLGQVQKYTTGQLMAMGNSLAANLEKRKNFKAKIMDKIDSNTSYHLFTVLDDMTIYDNLCSLHATTGLGDSNTTR
jgi:hypothetical protein